MTEEKKKEVAKKPEVIVNAFTELSSISTSITEAMREQEQISQNITNAMNIMGATSVSSRILASLDGLNGSLASIGQISTSWRENEAITSMIASSTDALSAITAIGSQISAMHQNIASMGKLIGEQETIETPLTTIIVPRINEVDSQKDTIIKSLVSQIEYLQSELSKRDARMKELIALLEEEKKDLKKQYVS